MAIALTQGMRSNLIALQGVDKLMQTTQNRLSTGKRVNSALDDPVMGEYMASRLPSALPEGYLRLVDNEEMTTLNCSYRGRNSATNVLSFPYEALPGVESAQLGDIVICAPVVAREAVEQDKPVESHWAHMVVHGALHLLGFDHLDAAGADRMETLETHLLKQLGYPDPYRPHDS